MKLNKRQKQTLLNQFKTKRSIEKLSDIGDLFDTLYDIATDYTTPRNELFDEYFELSTTLPSLIEDLYSELIYYTTNYSILPYNSQKNEEYAETFENLDEDEQRTVISILQSPYAKLTEHLDTIWEHITHLMYLQMTTTTNVNEDYEYFEGEFNSLIIAVRDFFETIANYYDYNCSYC